MVRIGVFFIVSLLFIGSNAQPDKKTFGFSWFDSVDYCDDCKYIVGVIESWLESNYTDEHIVNFLNQFCSYASYFAPLCDALVDSGFDYIINYIKTNENPTQVCLQIELCSSFEQAQYLNFPKDNCGSCQDLVNIVENFLASSFLERQIEETLEFLCNLIPNFNQTCDAVTERQVPTLIKWILESENASVVCQQLGVCTSEQANKQAKCGSCSKTVNSLRSRITDQFFENNPDQIDQTLQKLCHLSPWLECEKVIRNNLPKILEKMNNQKPQVICQNFDLC